MVAGNTTRTYYDSDADPATLADRTVGIIGYGNQGSAQAQNLRDSGISVLIGNRDDEYRGRSIEAGFRTLSIPEAAEAADVLLLLIPDEVQPEVFNEQIAGHLSAGDVLVVASGYNWMFDLLDVPPGLDVVMVAPRMIGEAVREVFVAGRGYPCFVSVEHDASGDALAVALAVARGIGATRHGAIASSAREETALDLFAEQALWPAIMDLFGTAYAVLRDAGFSDEAILHEAYLSGEPAEVFARIAESGLLGQLPLHSQTSQYGQLRGVLALAAQRNPSTDQFEHVLHHDILGGAFAREWSRPDAEQKLEELRSAAHELPLPTAEAAVRRRIADAT